MFLIFDFSPYHRLQICAWNLVIKVLSLILSTFAIVWLKNPSLIKFLWFSGVFTGHNVQMCTSETIFELRFPKTSPYLVCGKIFCSRMALSSVRPSPASSETIPRLYRHMFSTNLVFCSLNRVCCTQKAHDGRKGVHNKKKVSPK